MATERASSDSADRATEDRSWRDRHPTAVFLATSIVVPLLAAAAAIVGSRIGADGALTAAIAQQEQSLKLVRAEEARKKRGEVYAELIDAANSFADFIDNLRATARRYEEEDSRRAPGTYVPNDVEINDEARVRAAFISKLNQVFVYGSDEGYATAEELRTLFGDGKALTPVRQRLNPAEIGIERPAYDAALKKLQLLMCREVSAEPRPSCR
ncbi:hypothetical protein [Lentzea waywayandensis]|uniref:hypothetical protein n=1 Tax=Lentzea waywayandensis TaxID=84724 RepID=UPI001160A0A4|nr:hypothetical protein [Lentzea waywayandensis]